MSALLLRRTRPTGPGRSTRVAAAAVAATLALGALLTGLAAPASAARLVPINGVGSTWSSIAISSWTATVKQAYQMEVNYDAAGSSIGRKAFAAGTNADFGVSEIPYGTTDNGSYDAPPQRKFAYMPIVAGGTSFMYNLKIGGKRVTQLRLSGDTVVKMFTGVITTWNDPAIKADNPGLALPARKVVPVVRADGSGTTAQLTTWFSKKYPALWNAYCQRAGRNVNPCGITSQYPLLPGVTVARALSTGVASYVSNATNEGTITYVEYGYATDQGFPVASLLNASGYYVQPNAQNVAVGLLKAQINNDAGNPATYLTQVLDGVYDNPDKRAYPLSSYSYMIIPTAVEKGFSTDKGYTLAKFGYYFLCQGQQKVDDLGYSPLPINLVQAGFDQLKKIPGAEVQTIDVKGCNNPTFSSSGTNTLAASAPQPQECQKKGPTQCGTTATGTTTGSTNNGTTNNGTTNNGTTNNGTTNNGTTNNGTTNNGTTNNGTTNNGTTNNGTTNNGTTNNGTAAQGGTVVDPDTGTVVSAGQNGGTQGGTQSGDGQVSNLAAAPQSQSLPVTVAADATGGAVRVLLMLLAGALLLGVAFAPPIVAQWAGRRVRSR